jgi:DNA topoisomerase VI subunit B
VTRLRDNGENFDEKEMKKAQSAAKKRLRQFVDSEQPSKKKKRKSGNKGRCSNTKVTFFANEKLRLDEEENTGLRRSWELVYKKVMNELIKEDVDDGEEDTTNQEIVVLSTTEKWMELKFTKV